MISIVVCSINQKLLSDLKENIEKTIGIPYELNAVDNNIINNGICQVYNQAAKKSKYDILCFVHEDVIFHTIGWGKELLDLLSNPQIGIVGVSGSVYKSSFTSSWTACSTEFYRINTLQHYLDSKTPTLHQIYPDKTNYSQVAVVDGVFLATKKSILVKYNFDEFNLLGFHGYDLDISLQIGHEFQVVVTNEILLEHFSTGNYDRKWLSDMIILHKKWKNHLPLNCLAFSKKNHVSDYIALSSYLNHLIKLKFSKKEVLLNYILIITKYFSFNKFKFSRTVFKYLLINNG
jgi:hypothetical protein